MKSVFVDPSRHDPGLTMSVQSAFPEPLHQETLIRRDIDLFLFEFHASGAIPKVVPHEISPLPVHHCIRCFATVSFLPATPTLRAAKGSSAPRARKECPQSSALRLCRPPLCGALRVGDPPRLALATPRLRQVAFGMYVTCQRPQFRRAVRTAPPRSMCGNQHGSQLPAGRRKRPSLECQSMVFLYIAIYISQLV